MKLLALVLIAMAGAAATAIKLSPFSGIAVTLPDGTLDVATVGYGLVLVPANGSVPASVRVQVPRQITGIPLFKLTESTYSLLPPPAAGSVNPSTLCVYRNGLRLKAGTDYTVDAALTITALTPWADDDTLQADYLR